MKTIIIDGYVDEPAQFGVPPYISTYPRYCAGVLSYLGFDVEYKTIDELRSIGMENWNFLKDYHILILIAGVTVPGVYVGGTPIMYDEIERIGKIKGPMKLIAGPVVRGYTFKGGGKVRTLDLSGFEHVVEGDPEVYLYEILTNEKVKNRYELIDKVIDFSAIIFEQHTYFPNVMIELELARGCDRSRVCSFCTEPIFYGRMKVRKLESILKEVEVLAKNSVKHIRFGRISNILAYSYNQDHSPDHKLVKDLYAGVRRLIKGIKTLHTDNANPWYIVEHRKECEKILEIIVRYNTPGDVLSFGVESFDAKVLKVNKKENDPEKIIEAIKIVNDIGKDRDENGVPKLLPGVNLLFGLMNEDDETYDINFKYLKRILDDGLLLRRINIRKVIPFPKTEIYLKMKKVKLNESKFKRFKEKVRKMIDLPMLRKVFPIGTILRDVMIEKKKGNICYGRQIGSYPILVGVHGDFERFEKHDLVVIDHGYRSVTGLKYSTDLNEVSFDTLLMINGIGRKRAEKIILNRPFKNWDELGKILDKDILNRLKKIFHLKGAKV